jgi:hypothetical protein
MGREGLAPVAWRVWMRADLPSGRWVWLHHRGRRDGVVGGAAPQHALAGRGRAAATPGVAGWRGIELGVAQRVLPLATRARRQVARSRACCVAAYKGRALRHGMEGLGAVCGAYLHDWH